MRPVRSTINDSSLIMMGVPKRFCRKSLKDYDTFGKKSLKDVKDFVSDYLDNLLENIEDNRGICFIGSNGVGKSFLSCIILKEAYRHRYSCRRVTFSSYINAYTESWNTRNKDEKDVLESELDEKYKAVEFLVLEEIGKEIDSKVAAPILEDLLRYREDNGLVTILCTNLNTETLADRYGESCMSLLRGNTVPITIECKDKRNTAFKKRVRREVL